MTGPDVGSELESGLEVAAATAVGLEREDDVVVFVVIGVSVVAVRIDADAFAGSAFAPETVSVVVAVVAASVAFHPERWSELAGKATSGAVEAAVAAQPIAVDG